MCPPVPRACIKYTIRDLHTVDNGVLSHLAVELAAKDWDVLVAHFLGVDHVGHTFGPASQAMEDKLDQMDGALRSVRHDVTIGTYLSCTTPALRSQIVPSASNFTSVRQDLQR